VVVELLEVPTELCARDPTTPWFAFDLANDKCLLLEDGAEGNTTADVGWQWFEKLYGTPIPML